MSRWYANPRTAFVLSVMAFGVYAVAVPRQSAGASARQDDFNWTDEMPAGATLRVYTSAGAITVRQAAGRTARVHGVTQNAGRGEIRYESGRDGGDVRICALREGAECGDNGINHRGRGWGERESRARANFTVEVPRGVELRVISGNGDVAVDGATARVHASSGNGAVRVGEGAERVHASSGNGRVMVDGARGPVNASSGNGRVSVSTAAGPVEASSGNGDIAVSMAALRGDGDMRFSSGNGSITLTLPRDFGAEVEASTGNGGFESDFPVQMRGRMTSHRFSGTIGGGGRNLRISTGNGSIRLRRAGGE